MHTEQTTFIQYIKNTYPQYFNNCVVLEIGSLNVNGTARIFFQNCGYVGVDVGPGDGVDVVCSGHEYNAPDNIFDIVFSTECFEHNPYWFETFQNMIRVCKSGGMVFFTCAGMCRPEHGTARMDPASSPLTNAIGWGEYYRNLQAADFRSRMNFSDIFSTHCFIDSNYFDGRIYDKPMDLYFWGIKK